MSAEVFIDASAFIYSLDTADARKYQPSESGTV
jgi:hypothetical protein